MNENSNHISDEKSFEEKPQSKLLKKKKKELTPEEKAVKIESEKENLLRMIDAGEPSDTKDRVGFILSKNPSARNSDIELSWDYWGTFHRDIFDGKTLTREQFLALPKISSLCRSRAKIQNEYNLFLAEEEVRQQRGTLEDQFKNSAVLDRAPNLKSLFVYIDETGKTQEYLSLGSIWMPTFPGYSKTLDLRDWKKKSGIDYEFHFKDVKPQKLNQYKNFINKFLSLHPEISFKSIIIRNQGLRDKEDAIKDLTYHLIKKGVDHENETNRAPLPRRLKVTVDEENEAKDKLKLAEIKDKLESHKINGLVIGEFESKPSEGDEYIQIVDLFTGAINRAVNPQKEKNHKDELAEYILNILKIDIEDFINNDNTGDNLIMFSFLGPSI